MQETKSLGRRNEILRVDRQLRKSRDLLITSPPLSGLTTFLHQIGIYIEISEHFERFQVIHFDLQETLPQKRFIIEDFISNLCTRLGVPIVNTSEIRLFEAMEKFLLANENLRVIITLDNLQSLEDAEIIAFLQQIRVVSESRDSRIMKNVLFVIGAHCLDLRKYDPERVSPFNVAEKINLEDLREKDATKLVANFIAQSKYILSPLGVKYVCYLTGNHPYLINQVCSHLLHEIVPVANYNKRLNFQIIDSVIEAMCESGEDNLLRLLNNIVTELPQSEINSLRSILNGARYDYSRKTEPLRQLKRLGIITDSRGVVWQIRNPIFNNYLRQIPLLRPVVDINSLIPRRIFANLEGYQIIFQLENDLRDFVFAKMYEKYGNRWLEKIGDNVAIYAAGLKTKEMEGGWFPNEDLPVLAYIQLPHLRKIINENWSAIFHEYFKPQSIFEGAFEALEGIRNRIAHNRPLTDHEIDQLENYADRFRNCMYDKPISSLELSKKKHSS